MKLIWHQDAWAEYVAWQDTDRRIVRRINALIRDIVRGGDSSIGKPEILRGNLAGYRSRRIDGEHRLVYRELSDELIIVACRGHYS